MKFTVRKQILENILSNLQPFLEKKDQSQITSHIFMEAGEVLRMRGTDNEIGLAVHTDEITCEEPGVATCNGKKLLDIVRILKDDNVVLQIEGDQLFIKQARSKYKLPTFDATQYPKFPDNAGLPKIDINSLKLISAFKKVNPAIDTNNPKFELNGALLDIHNNVINIVATDTRRLALFKIDHESAKLLSLIIPKKAIQEIQKLFFNDLALYYDDTNLIIQSDNYYFFTKVINGKFPDYERIIPRELSHRVNLPKDRMIEAIKQVNIISSEIKMEFTPTAILFESLSNENMEAKTELECDSGIEGHFVIAVNSRYLIDFLSNIDTKEFIIGFNEANTPFQLKSENFTTIVMPIIL